MKSSLATHKSAVADRQGALEDNSVAARLRLAASEKSLTQKALADLARIPAARVNDYWKGPKEPTSKFLFALADALDVSAEWLALGRGPRRTRLVEVGDADWVEVLEFDLRQMTDETKGAAISSTLFRRDWLYLSLGESSGLWITRTLSPDPQRGLPAGAAIVCKDHPKGEAPIEGQIYVFYVNGGVMLGRFSYRGVTFATLGETIITPDDVNREDGQHFIVARVLGALARPFV